MRKVFRGLLEHRRAALAKKWASDAKILLGGNAISFLDVGASGGIIPRWQPYRGDVAFTGIEPDERSIPELLNSPDAKAFKSYDIVPFGAWNRSGPVPITFTRKPMCSSHFQPNIPFLSRFPNPERFDVVGSSDVACRTLDDLLGGSGKPCDFIKLDLEGGELAVLEGARATLGSCLGLHIEVSFQPIRDTQPLFGDVAGFLAAQGIEFIDFVTLLRWGRDAFDGLGQTVFADALFLRAPESLIKSLQGTPVATRTARVYLAILTIYERFDMALKFLDLLKDAGGVLTQEQLQEFGTLIRRRKTVFDRHYRWAAVLGRMHSRYAGPNYAFHFVY
jgi:FkbM family methyltransferase